jgi:hypothetical protein
MGCAQGREGKRVFSLFSKTVFQICIQTPLLFSNALKFQTFLNIWKYPWPSNICLAMYFVWKLVEHFEQFETREGFKQHFGFSNSSFMHFS